MKKKSMTALISAFSRMHHSQYASPKVYDDFGAKWLISEEEFNQITEHMANGILFFNPDFYGTKEEAVGWIVNHYLSPTPLGRAAFAENHLALATQMGVKQYIILAAGYDTFPYRQPRWSQGLQFFELDHPLTSSDKRERLLKAQIEIPSNCHPIAIDLAAPKWFESLLSQPSFTKDHLSFYRLLGISRRKQPNQSGWRTCDEAKVNG